ncbi:MAG: TonB-dependent receptor [Planctomycetales bacterium]|nr:TonB-dependent receptor [Planctomycetales bacterium]
MTVVRGRPVVLAVFSVWAVMIVASFEAPTHCSAGETASLPATPALDPALDPEQIDDLEVDDLTAGMASKTKGKVDAPSDELDEELDSLLDQDIGTLRRTSVAPSLDVEVSSVSRQKSTVGRSPAAVFVITEEMIRRSGYQSIPEVLRLAPGLQVARIDGNKWSISCRGESGRFSNKLLVQIDGRSVYNPLFAGVHWDIQDLLLDNILRIEVIRGPGATVWGANAVNGVINIITKPSSQTHGSYAIAGSGTLEQGFVGGRVGGRTAKGIDYRVWGKWYQRDEMDLPGAVPFDATQQVRAGFRTDWTSGCNDNFTLQGQFYDGHSNNLADRDQAGRIAFEVPVSGGHLLSRWTRTHSKDRDSTLQLYYDRFDRSTNGFGQQTNLFDVDYQNRFRFHCDHAVIWGLGYRSIFDNLTNNAPIQYISADPQQRTVQRFSGFMQDEITLLEDSLYLTLGSKLSHNTFSDFEVQPGVRLLWLPSESDAAWCSISRAVRTPSRLTVDGNVIVNQSPFLGNFPFMLRATQDLPAESLVAYEIGYRQQTNEFFSWDVNAYVHEYDNLNVLRFNMPPAAWPYLDLVDVGYGEGYGIELAATAKLTENWSMRGWYAAQRINYDAPPPAIPKAADNSGGLPRNQVSLTNIFDLKCGRQFDVITRYVDNLPAVNVPAYMAFDARFSWSVGRNFSASVVGRNLFDPRHPEYGSNIYTGDVATEVPRSLHAYLEWRR